MDDSNSGFWVDGSESGSLVELGLWVDGFAPGLWVDGSAAGL